jgi:hypothetical protein
MPAESISTESKQIVAGIVVVSVAVGVRVTFLVIHFRHKGSSITGCVISGPNGTSLADENDKRTYALSGDTAAVKPGERIRLDGKGQKENNGTFIFEVRRVGKVLGACRP